MTMTHHEMCPNCKANTCHIDGKCVQCWNANPEVQFFERIDGEPDRITQLESSLSACLELLSGGGMDVNADEEAGIIIEARGLLGKGKE